MFSHSRKASRTTLPAAGKGPVGSDRLYGLWKLLARLGGAKRPRFLNADPVVYTWAISPAYHVSILDRPQVRARRRDQVTVGRLQLARHMADASGMVCRFPRAQVQP